MVKVVALFRILAPVKSLWLRQLFNIGNLYSLTWMHSDLCSYLAICTIYSLLYQLQIPGSALRLLYASCCIIQSYSNLMR